MKSLISSSHLFLGLPTGLFVSMPLMGPGFHSACRSLRGVFQDCQACAPTRQAQEFRNCTCSNAGAGERAVRRRGQVQQESERILASKSLMPEVMFGVGAVFTRGAYNQFGKLRNDVTDHIEGMSVLHIKPIRVGRHYHCQRRDGHQDEGGSGSAYGRGAHRHGEAVPCCRSKWSIFFECARPFVEGVLEVWQERRYKREVPDHERHLERSESTTRLKLLGRMGRAVRGENDEDEMFMLTSVHGKVIDYETANRYSALSAKKTDIEQDDEGVAVPCENPCSDREYGEMATAMDPAAKVLGDASDGDKSTCSFQATDGGVWTRKKRWWTVVQLIVWPTAKRCRTWKLSRLQNQSVASLGRAQAVRRLQKRTT